MGPFFALGHLAGLQPWVIQRLWIGTVGAAAFAGVVLLCGPAGHRLAVVADRGRPRLRGLARRAHPDRRPVVGVPPGGDAAVDPVPLVRARPGRRRGCAPRPGPRWPWRCCGGINAAATFAVLVPVVVYLLTLPRPAPRWRILAWWVPAVMAATWWWSVPLVLLSRYGVSILPYTESAAVTTSVDRPVQRAARHRELDQLPAGERPALVAAGIPDRHRDSADPADRAGRGPGAGRAAAPEAPGPPVPALPAAHRPAHHLLRPREQPGEPPGGTSPAPGQRARRGVS